MLKLENKVTGIPKDFERDDHGNPVTDDHGKPVAIYMSYADIATLLTEHPGQGVTVSEMRRRFRIQDVAEKANGSLELPKEDFELIKRLHGQYTYGIVHQDLINLEDELEAVINGK